VNYLQGFKVSGIKLKLFLLLLSIFISANIYATPLKVAFGETRPPYIFEDGKKLSGIEVDIIRESLLLAGHTIIYNQLPNNRLQLAITKMNYDVAVGVLDHFPLLYSSEYMEVKSYAIAKVGKGVKLTSINDLNKYSVGAFPSAWINSGEEYKKMFAPDAKGNFAANYSEPLTSETRSKMFWRDRFDIAITNKVTFEYYKKSLARSFDTSADVIYYDIFKENLKFRVVFKDEKIRDSFESGLRQLRRSQRYLRIFQYYIQ
jgi:polar amino acid transport system substrate-binding protein